MHEGCSFLGAVFEYLQPHLPKMRVRISEDNEGAIKLAANPICTNRTKHIDVRHHFLREKVEKDIILLALVGSSDQHADALTKNLGSVAHSKHRQFLLNLK